MLLNNRYKFSLLILHWVSALLISSLFIMGKILENLTHNHPFKMILLAAHVILGFLLVALTFIRIYERLKYPLAPLVTGSNFRDKLIRYTHKLLYILIILCCCSGIISFYWGGYEDALLQRNSFLITKEGVLSLPVHGFSSFFLVLLIGFHVLGALEYYWISSKK